MKKKRSLWINYFIFISILGFYFFSSKQTLAIETPTLAEKLSGYILLQVEEEGQAWYINPRNRQLHFLDKPADALDVIKKTGIGISNKNLEKIPKENENKEGDKNVRQNLAGKILIQVENRGKAWYVYPKNLKRYPLGNPTEAFKVLKKLGLGISNKNLEKIPITHNDFKKMKSKVGEEKNKREQSELKLKSKTQRLAGTPIFSASRNSDDWDSHNHVAGNCIINTNDGRLALLYYANSSTEGMDQQEKIGLAFSKDGMTWERHMDNPVLTPGKEGEWDDGGVHVFPGCLTQRNNGEYYMYYTGDKKGSDLYHTGKIGIARSKDLIHWEKYEGNPIISPGSNEDWDGTAVFEPSVLFHGNEFGADASFEMWYTGSDKNLQFKIGYAKSFNGFNWEKEKNYVFKETGNTHTDFDGYSIEVHHVVKYQNQYLLLYEAIDRQFPSLFKIGLAFSKDGKTWRRSQNNPLFEGRQTGAWDIMSVHPAIQFMPDKILLYYIGLNNSYEHQMGLAEINPLYLDPNTN